MKSSLRQLIILACFGFLCIANSNAQFTINDVFADPAECTSMTRDIFVVWWDNDFDYTAEVDIMLDQMIEYRTTCLNDLNMADPPNTDDDFYYNIYLHGDGGFFDSNGWGNGQGTDSNGYPYLTLPYAIISDLVNLSHETFHIFQYNATSPGFAYSGDSQWYIEASANWFAGIQNIEAPRAFIEAESLVRLPHVPLWVSFDNFPSSYPENWQRYVHQYAMALFVYYLTEEAGVSPNLISEGFFIGTEEYPQEYLFNQIGGTEFRNQFVNWAAHMTNDFDFITPQQAAANENEWDTYADPLDENEFTEVYENTGTDGWYSPDVDRTTNAWSFNTYKLNNTENTSYLFEINGDPNGTFGDAAFFQGTLVVKNSSNATQFYDIPMSNDVEGAFTLELTTEDTEVYFIIASMPEIFEDPNVEFQLFPYEMRITDSTLGIDDFDLSTAEKTVIARHNLLGQEISKETLGLQIVRYSDGSVKKIFIAEN